MTEFKFRSVCSHCLSDDVAMINATAFYNGKRGLWFVETYIGEPSIECYTCGQESEEPVYVELCS